MPDCNNWGAAPYSQGAGSDKFSHRPKGCLLYTSDAADDLYTV